MFNIGERTGFSPEGKRKYAQWEVCYTKKDLHRIVVIRNDIEMLDDDPAPIYLLRGDGNVRFKLYEGEILDLQGAQEEAARRGIPFQP